MARTNRYSTIVSWVKIALPTLALGLLASLFLFSRTPDPDAALPLTELDLDQVAIEQRLSQPRFASTLDDGREITLIADSILQSSRATSQIFLETVEVELELSTDDGGNAVLNANDGQVDLIDQIADLMGDVRMRTSDGYHLNSDAMTIGIGEGLSLVSPGPVHGRGPDFELEAGAMELSGPSGAAVLHFTNGVRLLYGTGD